MRRKKGREVMNMGNNAWKSGIVIAVFLSIAIFMVETVSASPKSLYLIANHHTRAFDAWNNKQ